MASLKSKLLARKPKPKPPTSTPTPPGDAAGDIADLRRELAEVRAQRAVYQRDIAAAKSARERAETALTAEKIKRSLHSAAVAAGAIDPDDVVELTRSRGARLDGDRVVFGAGEETVDATAYVAKMLETKPHLRRALGVSQGSGSPARHATTGPATAEIPRPNPSDVGAVRDYYAAQIAAKTAAASSKLPQGKS